MPSTLFEASVRALFDDVRQGTRYVDPRPIAEGSATRMMFDENPFQDASDSERTGRLLLLERLGYRLFDIARLGRCPGTQALNPPPDAFRDCPSERQTIVLVGSTDAAERASTDTATVTALVIFRAPSGTDLRDYELTAVRIAAGWRVIRRRPGLIVE